MLVETSFIECVLHRAEPQHVGASAFWDHLDLADTRILYSAFTEFELFESARHKDCRLHVAMWPHGETCCGRRNCTGSGSMTSTMESQG